MPLSTVDYKKARRAFYMREGAEQVTTTQVLTLGSATYSVTLDADGPDSKGASLEGGTISITDGGVGVTWVDNNDGTLTGTGGAGGSGTYNTETLALTLDWNGAPTTADVTVTYTYLPVTGADYQWMEEVDMVFVADVMDQNPATGGFHGAIGIAQDFYYTFTGKTILTTSDVKHVSTPTTILTYAGTPDTISATIGYTYPSGAAGVPSAIQGPGIHNNDAYVTPAGWQNFTLVINLTGAGADVVTIASTNPDGTAVLSGTSGVTGTLNFDTGAYTLDASGIPDTFAAGNTIAATYSFLELPTHDLAFRGGGYGRRLVESDTEMMWQYYPTVCNHAIFGGRMVRKRTDCVQGLDYRGQRMRWTAVVSAATRERLMVNLDGFAATNQEMNECVFPTQGLLPDDPALVHTKADLDLVAYASDGTSQTFQGQQVAGIEIRNPFEVARLITATGEALGGTAEVILNAPDGARGEIDFSFELTRPGGASGFNSYKYLKEGNFFDITWEWYNRQDVKGAANSRLVRYACCAYAGELATEDDQEVMMVGFRGKLIHGVPSDTQSEKGRNIEFDLGRFEIVVKK